MEQHQRQHDCTHGGGGKEHIGHGNTTDHAFLGAAEHESDLVLLAEAQAACTPGGDEEHDGQQNAAQHDQAQQRGQGCLLPQAADDGRAEGGVDHKQDGALVHQLDDGGTTLQKAADHRTHQMTDDKGQQQRHGNLANGMHCIATLCIFVQYQAHQNRRDQNAQQGRGGRAAHGGRYIAARHGGEGNRRLHRGGQGAEKQHADIHLGGDQGRKHRAQRQPQHGEQHKGGDEDPDMQAPVTYARQDGLARELGAVQKEQQADDAGGGQFHIFGDLARGGQKAGEDDGGNQCQREVIGDKAGARHILELKPSMQSTGPVRDGCVLDTQSI